jgi:Domain of unknown function (DUF4878)
VSLPSVRQTGAIALAIALGAVAQGCATTTSSSFKGPAHNVAQTLSDLQSDVTAGDEQQVCKRDLASAVRARLATAAGSCAAALKDQLQQITDFTLTVQSVKVNGTTASAQVKSIRSGKNVVQTVELVKEGTRWKLSGLG